MDGTKTKIHLFQDIVQLGSEQQQQKQEQFLKVNHKPNDIVCIIYTSGTTGFPKGVVFRAHTWIDEIKQVCYTTPLIVFNFLPYSHMSGINYTLIAFFNGGRVGLLTQSDMNNIFDDFSLIRPTVLSTIPRVLNFVYHEFQRRVSLLEKKKSPSSSSSSLSENLVKREMKNIFGDRLKEITVGSAHCSHRVKKIIREICKIPVYDAYGSTEIGTITHGYEIDSEILTKLEDCPEIGYFSKDKPFPRGELLVKNRKSESLEYYKMSGSGRHDKVDEDGYFRTGDVVEKRGSKIVIIDRKNNVVKLAQGEFVSLESVENALESSMYVDQVILTPNPDKTVLVAVVSAHPNDAPNVYENSIMKVGSDDNTTDSSSFSSQKLNKNGINEVGESHSSSDSSSSSSGSDSESTTSGGSSDSSSDDEEKTPLFEEIGESEKWEDVDEKKINYYGLEIQNNNSDLQKKIKQDFERIGRTPKYQLKSWELPSTLRIVFEKFPLTGLKKKNRKRILSKYKDLVSEMFIETSLEKKQTMGNYDSYPSQTTSCELTEMMVNLGIISSSEILGKESTQTLRDLGDSFSGILIKNHIEKVSGQKFSFRELMEMTISDIIERFSKENENNTTDEIEDKDEGEDDDDDQDNNIVCSNKYKPKFIDLQREKIKFMNFIESKVEKQQQSNCDDNSSSLFEKYVTQPRCILITGSTGFLGKVLLNEIIRTFPESKVLCLVRSKVEEEEEEVEKKNISCNNVVKLVGDLSLPYLGFSSEKEFEDMFLSNRTEINMIIHCGAMVNHFADYGDHYETNIKSLYYLVQITKGFKPFIYISSISVYRSLSFAMQEEEEEVMEHFHSNLEEEKFPFCEGYSGSKWVCDCLLQSMITRNHQRNKRNNVMIVRPPLIIGDTVSGRYNPKDWLTSIIHGCLSAQCVPKYNSDDSTTTTKHGRGMNMIPVDFLSQSIVLMIKNPTLYDGFGENMGFENISFFELMNLLAECKVRKIDVNREEEEEEELEEQCGDFEKFRKVGWKEWVGELRKLEITHPVSPFIEMIEENEGVFFGNYCNIMTQNSKKYGKDYKNSSDVKSRWRKMNQEDVDSFVSFVVKIMNRSM